MLEGFVGESSEAARHDALRLATVEQMYQLPAREQSLRDYWPSCENANGP